MIVLPAGRPLTFHATPNHYKETKYFGGFLGFLGGGGIFLVLWVFGGFLVVVFLLP